MFTGSPNEQRFEKQWRVHYGVPPVGNITSPLGKTSLLFSPHQVMSSATHSTAVRPPLFVLTCKFKYQFVKCIKLQGNLILLCIPIEIELDCIALIIKLTDHIAHWAIEHFFYTNFLCVNFSFLHPFQYLIL